MPASSGRSASSAVAVRQVVERPEVHPVGDEADGRPGRDRPQVADLGAGERVQAGGSPEVLPLDQRRVDLLLPRLVPHGPGLGHPVRRDQVGDVRPRASRAPRGSAPARARACAATPARPDGGFQVGLGTEDRESGGDGRLPQPRRGGGHDGDRPPSPRPGRRSSPGCSAPSRRRGSDRAHCRRAPIPRGPSGTSETVGSRRPGGSCRGCGGHGRSLSFESDAIHHLLPRERCPKGRMRGFASRSTSAHDGRGSWRPGTPHPAVPGHLSRGEKVRAIGHPRSPSGAPAGSPRRTAPAPTRRPPRRRACPSPCARRPAGRPSIPVRRPVPPRRAGRSAPRSCPAGRGPGSRRSPRGRRPAGGGRTPPPR